MVLVAANISFGGIATTANAAETTAKVAPDAHALELMETFPAFKESFEKHTTGKLAGREIVYARITENKDPIESVKRSSKIYGLEYSEGNSNVEYLTEEEFEEEFAKDNSISTFGIDPQEGGYSSWVIIDLEVYYASGQSYYMAYNFVRWITAPKLKLSNGEAISISFSN